MPYRARKSAASLLAAACLIAGIASTSAYAYVLSSDTAVNGFSVADCRIQIEEEFETPDDVVPGSTIKKVVRVRNVGEGACYVRAYAEFDREEVGEWASIDFNDTDWTLEADGYRYCDTMLAEGEVSPAVCTTVRIDKAADPADLASFDVLVMAEGVSAKSPDGAPYKTAMQAFTALAGRGRR